MMSASVNKKEEMRKELLARRDALGEERGMLSEKITRHVLELPIWKKAKKVALYVSVRSEVSTEKLLDAAWQERKEVYLPRCLTAGAKKGVAGGIMEMARCRYREDLEPARFGLLEPRAGCPALPLLEPGEEAGELVDLIVVPAVGIGPDGARLGYGGGFYDRLLSRPGWREIRRVGLIFQVQLAPVPQEQGDVFMDGYSTEEGCVWI